MCDAGWLVLGRQARGARRRRGVQGAGAALLATNPCGAHAPCLSCRPHTQRAPHPGGRRLVKGNPPTLLLLHPRGGTFSLQPLQGGGGCCVWTLLLHRACSLLLPAMANRGWRAACSRCWVGAWRAGARVRFDDGSSPASWDGCIIECRWDFDTHEWVSGRARGAHCRLRAGPQQTRAADSEQTRQAQQTCSAPWCVGAVPPEQPPCSLVCFPPPPPARRSSCVSVRTRTRPTPSTHTARCGSPSRTM